MSHRLYQSRLSCWTWKHLSEKLHCLAEGSEWNLDKSVLSKGIINLEPVGDTSIFQLADMKNIYTVIRMDILESMLKRGARGVGITPLQTVKGEEM